MFVIINDEHGGRLCRDGKFRIHHVPFGTFPSNVKTYRLKGWALRKANELKCRGKDVYVREIKHGQYMDASGEIGFSS